MKDKRIYFGLIILFALACNFTSLVHVSTPTSMPPTLTATIAPPTPVPVYIPTQCVGQPVATLPAATTVAEPTLSVGVNPPLSKTDQLKIFEELTSPIPSLYIYPDFNGLDWPATLAKYRAKIEAGLDTETFYSEMQNLITELGDNHSQYLSPAELAADNATLAGRNDYVGIGIQVIPMLEKNGSPSLWFSRIHPQNMPG